MSHFWARASAMISRSGPRLRRKSRTACLWYRRASSALSRIAVARCDFLILQLQILVINVLITHAYISTIWKYRTKATASHQDWYRYVHDLYHSPNIWVHDSISCKLKHTQAAGKCHSSQKWVNLNNKGIQLKDLLKQNYNTCINSINSISEMTYRIE
jgi:hypothetical protein